MQKHGWSHILRSAKEARHKRIYIVLLNLHEIQEQAKSTHGDRSHDGGYLLGGIDCKGA